MIKAEMKQKDLNLYLKELVWFSCKPLFIILFVCFVPIIYFLLVGYLSDREALYYGYGILCLFLLSLFIIVRCYLFYKKNLKIIFSNTNSQGNIEYLISEENDEFIFENITNKTINRLKFNNIKLIQCYKTCIIIQTNLNQIIWFPKNNELMALFNIKPRK